MLKDLFSNPITAAAVWWINELYVHVNANPAPVRNRTLDHTITNYTPCNCVLVLSTTYP